MPKTTKIFDWEVYDNKGEFIDIISASRDAIKKIKEKFPNRKFKEIDYTNDRDDLLWNSDKS